MSELGFDGIIVTGVAENPKGVEMSSSKSRDYRAQVIYLFFVALSVMNFNSAIRAGDKEEEKTACFLVDSLNKLDEVSLEESFEQWKLIPRDSKYYLVATQALVIRSIVDDKYSEAWKLVGQCDAEIDKAPESLRLGHQVFKIWLLFEARKPESVKPVLRLFAKKVTTNGGSSADSSYGIEWLAKFNALMNAPQNSKASYEKELRGISTLVQQSSQGNQRLFRSVQESCQAEIGELDAEWSRIQEMSPDERAATGQQAGEKLRNLESEVEQTRKAARDSLDEFRDADKKWKQLGSAHKRKAHDVDHLHAPGRPNQPKKPDRPSRPSGRNDEREQREYLQKEREYDAKMNQYERDMRAYQQAYAEWKIIDDALRNKLRAELAAIGQDLNVAAQERKVKQTSDDECQKSLRKLQSSLKQEQVKSRRLIEALDFANAPDSSSKSIVTPSRLRNLNLEGYVAKLNQVIREID